MKEHKCDRKWAMETTDTLRQFYGPAVYYIEGRKDGWYAHNEEYATRIKYCPFCGVELPLLNWEEKTIDVVDQKAVGYGIVDKDL